MFWSAMFFNSSTPETGSTVFRSAMMNQDAFRTTTRDQRALLSDHGGKGLGDKDKSLFVSKGCVFQ